MDILLNSKTAVNAIDVTNNMDVQLNHTARNIPYNSEASAVNQYKVYESEALGSSQYRIVLTVKPFCSNVLFNCLTEILDENGLPIIQCDKIKTSSVKSTDNLIIYGKNSKVSRDDMVQNTEYSKLYEYLPGLDIFDNHLFRSKSFTIINPPVSKGISTFNTIEDVARNHIGKKLKKTIRLADSKQDPFRYAKTEYHVYGVDNTTTYSDSIINNLTEDNGWIGFLNNSHIDALVGQEYNKLKPLGINKVLMNHEAGDFIDMYPDRSLFSFTPKYNERQKRLEYNWKVYLTYPYEIDTKYFQYQCADISNDETIEDVKPYDITALPICDIQNIGGDRPTIILRSLAKHNLQRGDIIQMFYRNLQGYYTPFESLIKVSDIGDVSRQHSENYFTLDYEIFEDNNIPIKKIKEYAYIFRKVEANVPCEYYIRKFKVLPNFKLSNNKLLDYIASDKELFEQYVNNNSISDSFAQELHQMGFAQTIYGDKISEVVFTDTIDLDKIRDHRGRELTSIYATIIKNNKGYKTWETAIKSDLKGIDTSDIEYSHCFGKLTQGFPFHINQYNESITSFYDNETYYGLTTCFLRGNINYMNNLDENYWNTISKRENKIPSTDFYTFMRGLEVDNATDDNKDEINPDDEIFFGDLVELNKVQDMEYVLENVHTRFNTLQRESHAYEKFSTVYHNIVKDDYDNADENFSILTFENGCRITNACQRPEGYHYQTHYEIPIREFSDVQQASHYELYVKEAKPLVTTHLNIEITCNKKHNLEAGDTVLLSDGNGMIYKTVVTYTPSKLRFVIKESLTADDCVKAIGSDKPDISFNTLIEYINNGRLLLYRVNPIIPLYANEIANNQFIWRDVLSTYGASDPTIASYPFANGHFYIEKDINFFLRRQDPYHYSGLYSVLSDGITDTSDLLGEKAETSNYEYTPSEFVPC